MTNKNKNNNKKRLTLFINPAIAKHARAQAVLEEISLTALVERALIKYLPKETVIKKVDARDDIREDYDP
jgi:predicted HicB family RNase H-like nuclease